MYFGLGTDFTRRKMISQKEDIFYLTVQELKGIFDAGLTIQDLKPLITLRKNSYFEYAKTEPLNRFITRGPVYEGLSFDPFEKDTEQSNTDLENPNFLTGIGCSSGIVEGVVKIVLNPTDDLDLNGHILVTYRTDPGWIPLYPSISGLLVERGGLLSHSAIVAREMGVPTIVSIKNLTQILKNGMQVKINGEKGTIEIISDSPKEQADHNGNFF
jgi:pyruvate,water dikinase